MQQQQILGSFVYYLEGVSYGNLFISALGPTQALILWGGLPHLRQNLEVCLLLIQQQQQGVWFANGG